MKKKNKKNILKNKNNKSFRKKVKRNKQFRIRKRKHRLISLRTDPLYKAILNKNITRLYADEDFELLKDPNNVINYISHLKSYKSLYQLVKTIYIDLSLVKKIDIGSVSLLLSSIKELNIYGINIEGNLPKNEEAKEFIINSGYLKHMSEVSKKIDSTLKTVKNKNLLVLSGSDKSESKKIGICLKEAIGDLYGTPQHYPAIYGMIQEINGNSVEHAYTKRKHWLFGINFDAKNQKLIFTFTDNGYGILQTLKRRFKSRIFDAMNLKNDEDILKGAFEKLYNSRFKKQYNRNKGLPVIKKAQSTNKISNLLIITNNVLLHIETNQSLTLNNQFSGTFYYWELDLETFKHGKNIN